MPSGGMKIEEVDNMAVGQPIYQIADCATQDEGHCRGKQGLVTVLLQQIQDDYASDDAYRGKEVTLPSTLRCQEAEGRSFVIHQHQIEERGDRVGLSV